MRSYKMAVYNKRSFINVIAVIFNKFMKKFSPDTNILQNTVPPLNSIIHHS